MILMFIHNTLEWIKDVLSLTAYKLKNTITKLVVLFFIFVILLWMSVFLYGSFYYVYMPPVSVIKPVSFGFSVCEDGDTMCSYPSANLTLLREGYSEVFVRGESYSIKLHVEVPESPTNKDLGMFMTKLHLYDKQGETVAVSTRSAMLQYRSELLRVIDTFVFSPMFLSGFAEQKQSLTIEFYSNYKDDAYRPAVGALIEVQSLKIQIYSALLKVHVHFSGLRYLLFHWPLVSSVIGVTIILMFLSFIALLSWYQFLLGNGKEADNVHSDKDRRKGGFSLSERKRNVQAMLDREREEQLLDKEDLRQKSSEETRRPIFRIRHPDTLGPDKHGQSGPSDRTDPDDSEEAFYIAKDQLEPECDTELRQRKHLSSLS